MVRVIAHRGDCQHGCENTLQAFQSVIDRGFKAIEVDLQLTRDKHVVLFHDFDLYRFFSDRRMISEVDRKTLDRLASVLDRHNIPHLESFVYLEQLFEFAYRYDLFVVCELKVKSMLEADEILKQFYDLYRSYPIDHVISSFADFVPYSTFFNSDTSDFIFNNYQPLMVYPELISGICLHASMFTDEMIRSALEKNHQLYVYGIDHKKSFDRFLTKPFSGLIIDDLSWSEGVPIK